LVRVAGWPLEDEKNVVHQDLVYNLLNQLYSAEGSLKTGDLAVSVDTDGIGVKIAPGGAIISYDSIYGGKRVFQSSVENKSGANEFFNPGFVTNTVGWSAVGGATLTRDTGTFQAGVASCKIATSGSSVYTQGMGQTANNMRVNSSQLHEVSCWVNAPVGVLVKLKVSEYTSAFALVTTREVVVAGNGVWVKAIVQFTTEATTKFAKTEVLVSSGSSTNVFVDSFENSRSFDWIESFRPADPTNPRIDRVVAVVQDASISGGGDTETSTKFRVVSGVATSGATLSNLSGAAAIPSNSLLLANVLIPAGATALVAGNLDTTKLTAAQIGIPASIQTDINDIKIDVAALESAFPGQMFFTPINPVNAVGLVANLVVMTQITVHKRVTVASVGFIVAVSAGTIDFGIYNKDFQLLWHRGNISSPAPGSAGASIFQGTPTTLTLEPGIYWFALTNSSGTFEFAGLASGNIAGVSKETANTPPLPATVFGVNGNRAIHALITGA
jgi:hypothetical protein